MKVEFYTANRPPLRGGQLWQSKVSGKVYLSVNIQGGMYLVNTKDFDSTWSAGAGFGGAADDFEYVGQVQVTP